MNHINLFLTCHEDQDIRSSNKHAALQNLSIYYMWKNMRKQYKDNKLKTIALTWNDEFKVPDDILFSVRY